MQHIYRQRPTKWTFVAISTLLIACHQSCQLWVALSIIFWIGFTFKSPTHIA